MLCPCTFPMNNQWIRSTWNKAGLDGICSQPWCVVCTWLSMYKYLVCVTAGMQLILELQMFAYLRYVNSSSIYFKFIPPVSFPFFCFSICPILTCICLLWVCWWVIFQLTLHNMSQHVHSVVGCNILSLVIIALKVSFTPSVGYMISKLLRSYRKELSCFKIV